MWVKSSQVKPSPESELDLVLAHLRPYALAALPHALEARLDGREHLQHTQSVHTPQ
jgi:hypothetical protein